MLQSAAHIHTLERTGNAPPVLAFMHATAVNQDGRSSSLTAPNGPSQQGVIRQALQASALKPHQMHAVQLHGTGMQPTLAGHPKTAFALAQVMHAPSSPSSLTCSGCIASTQLQT